MIRVTFVCDKCKAEVSVELADAREMDRANWRNEPAGWISVGVDNKVLHLCDKCNGSVVSQKDQIKALEASIKVDVAAAVSAKVGE